MSFLRKIKRKRERVRERFKLLLPFLTFLMHTYVGKHQGHEQKSGSKQDCYTSNRLGGMKQTIIFLYAYSDGSDGKGSLFWLTSRQSSFQQRVISTLSCFSFHPQNHKLQQMYPGSLGGQSHLVFFWNGQSQVWVMMENPIVSDFHIFKICWRNHKQMFLQKCGKQDMCGSPHQEEWWQSCRLSNGHRIHTQQKSTA